MVAPFLFEKGEMRCGQVNTSGKYFGVFLLPVEFGHGQLPVKISVHSLCINLYPWRVNQ